MAGETLATSYDVSDAVDGPGSDAATTVTVGDGEQATLVVRKA